MSTTPKPLTGAERVARVKEAKREAGLKEIRSLWAYPEDHEAVRTYTAKLTRKRGEGEAVNIEALAREAGFKPTTHLSGRVSIASQSMARFERFAALVRAQALEDAAQLCDEVATDLEAEILRRGGSQEDADAANAAAKLCAEELRSGCAATSPTLPASPTAA